MSRVLRFGASVLTTVVLVVSGSALLAGLVVPRLAGATPYTVLTGSMQPTLPVGTLAVVRPVPGIGLGDIVTFQVRSGDPQVVTHRVVGVGISTGGEPSFLTKGDANPVADPAPVLQRQVRGALWYAVPYLGYLSVLMSPDQRQVGVLAVATALLGYAAWQVVQTSRSRRRTGAARPQPMPSRKGDE